VSVIWAKVWYDLWRNKVRTLLAVLSISAGVFSVGAIFGMSDQMLKGMDSSHQAVMPSHINMYLGGAIDMDTALSLRKVPGVEDVEPYNSITVRYKIHPGDEWRTGLVDMRSDYNNQKYDYWQLKSGQWPQDDHIAVERLTSDYFGVAIGQSVILEVNKLERSFPISGLVRHPFVPPPQFGGQAYFFMDAAGMERFGVKQDTYAALRMRVTPYSEDYAKTVATDVKERLARQGVSVEATIYQKPDKHWGRMFMEGMTLVMQVMAVLSLITSVILVFNTLTALVTQQINQIGMIKAIGGTTATVAKVYLVGVLAYGALALTVSLPLGVYVAFVISRWMLNLFNIDYSVFKFSNMAVTFQVISALAVPLLAGLWPVLKGAGITVREAIASYGIGGGKFGGSRLDRLVERIGQKFLPSAYALALGNTFRKKGRLILSEVVLVLAGTMFLMVMSLSSSITATLDAEFGRRAYDIILMFNGLQRLDRSVQLAESVPGVTNASGFFSQSATVLRDGQKTKEAGVGSTLMGIPVESDTFRPQVVAGRWLEPNDGRVVVISKDKADDNHLKLGDTITLDVSDLGKSDWQIVGLYKMVFGGGFSSDEIYAPQATVFDVTKKQNRTGTLYVRLDPAERSRDTAITTQLEDLFRDRNMKVYYATTLRASRESADSQFSMMISMLLALAVIVAIVGGIGLMGALSIGVIERTKEIGVMRAIGARSRTVLGMFVMEGVLQGVLSWIIAVPVSLLISAQMADLLGQTMFSARLSFQYNIQAVFVWLVIVVVISTLASLVPARSATHISVRQSLAYE
jgi:putative ABC transport system permease protein